MDIIKHLKLHWDSHQDDIFIIDSFSGLSHTYGDIRTKSMKLSQLLKSKGIRKGDRIAILMSNCIDFAQLYMAAMYMGCVAVPINPQLGVELAKYVIADSGAKLLISDSKMEYAAELAGDIKTIFFDTITELSLFDADAPFQDVLETDELIVVYTSGTTSNPKGVVHTYRSLFSNGIEFTKAMGIGGESRFINILPMAYLGGYYNLLLIPFIAGGSVVLCHAFQAADVLSFWQPIVKHGVNTLWLVPTIIAMLMEFDRGSDGVE